MKHYPNSVSKALALLTALVMTLSLAVTSAFAVSYQDMNPKDDALLGTKFPVDATITLVTDENGKEYEAYGFTYGGIVEATPLLRLQYSWYQTMDYVRIVRLSLQMLLSGAAGVNDLSGPVGIVSTITEVGKETEATEGFGAALENILFFAAMIAVNLAVMNLLPLPALDGGHVLFLLVNGIAVALFKKEIPSKYLNVINGIGFALLMALMLFVTFHDIVKLL